MYLAGSSEGSHGITAIDAIELLWGLVGGSSAHHASSRDNRDLGSAEHIL